MTYRTPDPEELETYTAPLLRSMVLELAEERDGLREILADQGINEYRKGLWFNDGRQAVMDDLNAAIQRNSELEAQIRRMEAEARDLSQSAGAINEAYKQAVKLARAAIPWANDLHRTLKPQTGAWREAVEKLPALEPWEPEVTNR